MTLNYGSQHTVVDTLIVSNPAVAVNIILGWTPSYVRAVNINDATTYEHFSTMAAGTSVDTAAEVVLNAAGSITDYAGRAAGTAVTGTVTVTADSPTITGVGTNFVGELAVGDKVTINGETVGILSITSSTVATADKPFAAAAAAVQLFDMSGKGPGFTLGADICDTAADVVHYLAIR